MQTRNRGRRNSNERGNTATRRKRKLFLLNKFGRQIGEHWVAQCWECSIVVTFHTVVCDRIKPGEHGGRYDYNNIRPHCPKCSARQGNRRTSEIRRSR